MKNQLAIILFLTIFGKLFSQHLEIPEIDFTTETENINPYIELLNIKDEQALIIKIGNSDYRSDGLQNNFLVFQNDGKIVFYECFFPYENDKERIKKRQIPKSKRKLYWDFLTDCVDNNRFSFVNHKLNITERYNQDGTVSIIYNSHGGVDYYIEIAQGNKYSAYSSYSPESYIQSKFPGWEEREKFVDLIKDIYKLTKKY